MRAVLEAYCLELEIAATHEEGLDVLTRMNRDRVLIRHFDQEKRASILRGAQRLLDAPVDCYSMR